MATVACKCGEKFHPSPEHYGKEVKCRRCGRTVKLIPDPAFDPPPPPPPPPPKPSGFTQTFGNKTPHVTFTAPQPPQAPEPPLDPNAPPPGLHPEVRRILIYAFLIGAIVAAGLIFSSFKGSTSKIAPVEAGDGAPCC